MKYPINVSPHMTTVDADIQQCYSFDFYGDDMTGTEIYLFDAITNECICMGYSFGRNSSALSVEEASTTVLNMQRTSINFGQLGTKSYYLENGRKYKYYLMISQSKINQFLFQGGITGILGNGSLLVTANSLLHSPREYSNEFMTFGYYLAVDIGNERRQIVNSYNYDGSNYCLVFDKPFTQSLSIGTQYRVYSNYVKSPEYVFKTRKNPTTEIVTLDNQYLSNGGSAWYCNYSQEDGILIKSYKWKIEDYTNMKSELYSGNILRPTTESSTITKEVSETQTLTTKANMRYLINDYNNVVEEELDGNNVYLRVCWSDIVDNTNTLPNDDYNYVYVYGTKEHTYGSDDVIKLTKANFMVYNDSGTTDSICYVSGFTTGVTDSDSSTQDIIVGYYDTLGTLLGECKLSSSKIKSGGCYEFSISQNNRSSSAKETNMSIVKMSDIPQSTLDKELTIIIQGQTFKGFAYDRYYCLGAEQELNIIWKMKETISIEDDDEYSSSVTYNSQTLYIDKGLSNVIGKKFYVGDTSFDISSRNIIGYDSNTGVITLSSGYSKYPSESATYHIFEDNASTLIETEDFYKMNTFYRNSYLAIDKVLKGTINIRTENDSTFTLSKTITFPKSEKDENGNALDILQYLDDNNNIIVLDEEEEVENEITNKYTKIKTYFNSEDGSFSFNWLFKSTYITNTQSVCVYREEENRNQIDLIHSSMVYENMSKILNCTDYCVGNNVSYRYVILLQVKATGDINGEVSYKYYKYVTPWYCNDNGSWTITGLEKTSATECGKDVYYIQDTWRLYSQLESADIVQNINTQVHQSYSNYPKVGKLGNNYISGSLSAMLGTIDCDTDNFVDDFQKVSEWRDFIIKYDSYILRSQKGDVWQVSISDNPTTNYDEELSLYTTISFSYTQINDIHNIYVKKN